MYIGSYNVSMPGGCNLSVVCVVIGSAVLMRHRQRQGKSFCAHAAY